MLGMKAMQGKELKKRQRDVVDKLLPLGKLVDVGAHTHNACAADPHVIEPHICLLENIDLPETDTEAGTRWRIHQAIADERRRNNYQRLADAAD